MVAGGGTPNALRIVGMTVAAGLELFELEESSRAAAPHPRLFIRVLRLALVVRYRAHASGSTRIQPSRESRSVWRLFTEQERCQADKRGALQAALPQPVCYSRTTKHLELRFSSLLNEEDSRVTPMLDSS